MPCNPSAPPVQPPALLASSSSIAATTSVSISSVSSGGAQDDGAGDDAEPAGRQRRREAGDRLAPAVRGEDAGGVGAGAEEGGVAERDDAGIAEHEIDRQGEEMMARICAPSAR